MPHPIGYEIVPVGRVSAIQMHGAMRFLSTKYCVGFIISSACGTVKLPPDEIYCSVTTPAVLFRKMKNILQVCALKRKQRGLFIQPARVSGQTAAAAHHPVARHQNGDRVVPHRTADRLRGQMRRPALPRERGRRSRHRWSRVHMGCAAAAPIPPAGKASLSGAAAAKRPAPRPRNSAAASAASRQTPVYRRRRSDPAGPRRNTSVRQTTDR